MKKNVHDASENVLISSFCWLLTFGLLRALFAVSGTRTKAASRGENPAT
jgi:hypothetical protein